MWKFDLRTVFFSTNRLFSSWFVCVENSSSNLFSLSKIYFWLAFDRSNGIDCERGQKIHIRIFNFIKSCRTCVNIFEILIPHFMKVGGSLYLLQNSMDDSPICCYEFSGNFFCPNPKQLTLWLLENWILLGVLRQISTFKWP